MSHHSLSAITFSATSALSALFFSLNCHAQSLDSPFTARELREQSREFRPSRSRMLVLESTPPAVAPSELKFSGGIGASFAKSSDGSSFASLPIEVDITHVKSGVTLVLASDLHAWARDSGETVHGAGALTAILTRKWVVEKDVASLTGRAVATVDSGSDVSDPSGRLIALVYGRKLGERSAMFLTGSIAQGPSPTAMGVSRNSVAVGLRVNQAIGANDEHTAWAKFGASHRSGAGSRTGLTLGVDFSLVPDVWDGTFSIARGLSGSTRTTTASLDFTRSF